MSIKVIDPMVIGEAELLRSDIQEPDSLQGEIEWVNNRLKITNLSPPANLNCISGCYVSGVGYYFLSSAPPLGDTSTVLIYDENLIFIESVLIDHSGDAYGENWAIVSAYDETDGTYSTPAIITIDSGTDSFWIIKYSDDMATKLSSTKVAMGFSLANYTFSKNWAMTTEFAYFSGYNTIGSANNNGIFKIKLDDLTITEVKPQPESLKSKSGLILIAGADGITAMTKAGASLIDFAYVMDVDLVFVKSFSLLPAITRQTRFALSNGEGVRFFNGVAYSDTINKSDDYRLDYKSDGIYKAGEEAIKVDVHKKYRCLVDTFVDPEVGATGDASATWLDIGTTNKWAMFDNFTTSYSVYDGEFSIEFESTEYLNSTAAIRTSGLLEIDVEVRDSVGALIYQNTLPAIDSTHATDPIFQYGGDHLFYLPDIYDDEIPSTQNASVKLIFKPAVVGGEIKIGSVIGGQALIVGKCLSGTSRDIVDYSGEETDVFGRTTYVKRDAVVLGEYSIASRKEYDRILSRLFDTIRTRNTLWIGKLGDGQEMLAYGSVRRSAVPYNIPEFIKYNITVKGST